MQIEIRRVRPSDSEALTMFYAGLAPDSRRARFLGTCGEQSAATSRMFCTPDHMHEEGFIAIAPTAEIVGHLCLVQSAGNVVELGVAVSDKWQGQGIGRRLFESALEWARDRGVESIEASCFADNWRVLALLSSAPQKAVIAPADGGIVDVTIPLNGPIPGPASWPPYTDPRDGLPRHRRAGQNVGVRRLRASWPRKRRPVHVAGG